MTSELSSTDAVTARPLLALVWTALAWTALAAAASGQGDPYQGDPYPKGGMVRSADGSGPRYEFVTRPDSTVQIRSSRGDALVIEPDDLRRIAEAYGGDLDGGAATVRAGYSVDDGALTVYLSRRLPVRVALALVGLGGLGLIGLGAWAARRIRADARRKRALEGFRETLAAARESERVRLARELHDGPLQELHVVRMQLAAAGDAGLEGELLGAIGEVRQVVEDLRPPDLERYSLGDAVGALVRRFRERNPAVALDAEVTVDAEGYSDELQLTLYRLAQEALANAAEHAGASRVRLSLAVDPRRFALAVEDDGAGLAPGAAEAAAQGGRFGLVGMAERAEAAGARFSVGERPDGGTRVAVEGVASP